MTKKHWKLIVQYRYSLFVEKFLNDYHFLFIENVDGFPLINIKHNLLKKTFSLSAFLQWKKLDPTIRNAESFAIFRGNILKFIRHTAKRFIDCYNHKGIRIMTQFGLGMSHLREHKFNSKFWKLYQSSL